MGTWKVYTRNVLCFLSIFCILGSSSLWAVQAASIVICAETGKVHHEKNADKITHPASLTKMMTLYLTFKALKEGKLTFDQKLPVSKHATQVIPSKLGLKAGSTITVRQAILGLVTKSANDAAVVVAEALARGSETHFATVMTQQARRLGMSNTVFKNAHGLPNAAQVTTARDMATLSRALYKDFPEYFKFFKEPKFAYNGHVHINHNRLLGKVPGLDGIKTGFINASGFNLAASVVRDNRRIIAIVMGGESSQARNKKMEKLIEATYSFLAGQRTGQKNSIDDLLCSLLPPEKQTKKQDNLRRVVYQPQRCQGRLIKAKYASVDDILSEHDSLPVKKNVLKKGKRKTQKAPHKLRPKKKSR
jgi:D-alanyl-D-alanine carboxypeptidase